MTKYFIKPFAEGGDKIAVPDDTQGNSTVSYEEGYTPEYEADQESDPNALDIEREKQNQLFFDITENLRSWQTFGVFEFITSVINGGNPFPYGKWAKMLWTDGNIFESKIIDNETNPQTHPGNWNLVSDFSRYVVNWLKPEENGSGLAIPGSGLPALSAMSGTDVAFIGGTGEELGRYRYDGDVFALLGSVLSIPGCGNPALAALSDTVVAFIDGDLELLSIYSHLGGGGTFSLVGTPLSIPGTDSPSLAALNGTDVALIDSNNELLQIYRFDFGGAETWSTVGNPKNLNTDATGMASLNETTIVIADTASDTVKVIQFDGVDWNTLSSKGVSMGLRVAVTALNATDFVFCDNSNDEIRIYRFDFTSKLITQVGGVVDVSPSTGPAMAAVNGIDFAFIDDSPDVLELYRIPFYMGDLPNSLKIL